MPSTPPECSPDPSPQTAVGPTPACPLPTLALLANPNPQSVTNAQPDFPPAYSLDPESSSSISSAGHPSSPSALATRPDALPPGASTLPSSTSSSPSPSPSPSPCTSVPTQDPPPYALLDITPSDQASYENHLLRHALRDLHASQDPAQWGIRKPAQLARARARARASGREEDEEFRMGGWVGWARWLGRLFDPVRDEVRAVGAFEGMGAFGGMMWS